MTYAFGKLAWLVIRPGNLFLLAALAGLLGLALRRRRAGTVLLAAGVLLMAVCTALPIGLWLMLPLENRFPRPAAYPERIDGAIVLGGGINGVITEARGVPTFGDTMERFATLPELARRYPDARVIFTGGPPWHGPGTPIPEAAVIERFLRQQGLPRNRVLLEDRARSTRENALFSLPLARPQPGERWLLVTSASHMPRAMGVFRQAGWPELQPWPVDYRTAGRPVLDLPSMSDRLLELDAAAYEWYGLLYYRLLGYTSALFPGPAD